MTWEEAMAKVVQDEREKAEIARSHADTREHWLKELDECLKWIATNIGSRPDEYLAWYTEPGSPGLFDHGITAERIHEAMTNLDRAAKVSFGGPHGSNHQRGNGGRTKGA